MITVADPGGGSLGSKEPPFCSLNNRKMGVVWLKVGVFDGKLMRTDSVIQRGSCKPRSQALWKMGGGKRNNSLVSYILQTHTMMSLNIDRDQLLGPEAIIIYSISDKATAKMVIYWHIEATQFMLE